MRAKIALTLAAMLLLGGCYVYPMPPNPPSRDEVENNPLAAKDLPPPGQAPAATPPFAIVPAPVYVWPAPGPWYPPPPGPRPWGPPPPRW
jgi:hypothetical protein